METCGVWKDQKKGYLFNVSYPRTLKDQACPPKQIYGTNIEDPYLTQDPSLVHLLEVYALNEKKIWISSLPSSSWPQHREKIVAVRRKVGRKRM